MPAKICEWSNERQAFAAFAGFTERTESAGHIKPLHWYVACRLVLEGGFRPETITPRPPFVVERASSKAGARLVFDSAAAAGGEATLLGGLKTKNVDVVVSLPGVGPVLAVSCKGTTGAYRNLTNRMEELIGDCTNLHISYPALVMGYLHLMRANRRPGEMIEVIEPGEDDAAETPRPKTRALKSNDMAFDGSGAVIDAIRRFAVAVDRLAGRGGIRDDITRYEAIGLALVEAEPAGDIVPGFPDPHERLEVAGFFERLYAQYDERFVFGAPKLEKVTRRLEWSATSPALKLALDYPARLKG